MNRDAASGIGWMYKGEKPESEEYLLGKRIDKHVEGEEDKKEGWTLLFCICSRIWYPIFSCHIIIFCVSVIKNSFL